MVLYLATILGGRMYTAQRVLFYIAITCLIFLGGIHVGRIEGASRLLNKQVKSADFIVTVMQCEWAKKEVRKDIDDFTYDVCKGLGLIKEEDIDVRE